MHVNLLGILGEIDETDEELYLSTPVGIEVKGKVLAIADLANNRIVVISDKIVKIGKYGTKPLSFDLPIDVRFDRKGYVLVTEIGNHRIQKFDSKFDFVKLWGGFGKIPGKFNIPNRIAVDKENNYYVVDEFNRRIQKFDEDGNVILIFGRGYGKEKEMLSLPQGISYDESSDTIWLSDTYANKIKMFTTNGRFVKEFGKSGSELGELNLPRGIYVDGEYIYVADSYNHRIQKFDKNGNFLHAFGGFPKLAYPVAVIKQNNLIYVSEAGNSRISIFEESGSSISLKSYIGLPRNKDGQFSMPSSVAVDSEENVYVSDSMNHRIQKFNRKLEFVCKWGKNNGYGGWDGFGKSKGEFFVPMQLCCFKDLIYVSDSMNCRIQVFSSNGDFLSLFGSFGKSDGEFMLPQGVAVDKKGNIYVSDTANHRIQKFDPQLEHLMTWEKFGKNDGEFNTPMHLAVDDENNLYVVDRNNNRIQKFDEDGKLVAKWGSNGGNGCSDPLLESGSGKGEFLLPAGICVWKEYIVVADWGNSRVQIFDKDGEYISEFGELGSGAGAFFRPTGVALKEGRIYITDQLLNKVFVFEVEL